MQSPFFLSMLRSILVGLKIPNAENCTFTAISQYGSVKEIYLLRQAGGAGDAGEAGGEKRLN